MGLIFLAKLPKKNIYGADGDVKFTSQQSKEIMLDLIRQGFSVEDACRAARKSVKTYEYYRYTDKDFCRQIDLAREIRRREIGRAHV